MVESDLDVCTKADALSAGDQVRLNDRTRPLTVTGRHKRDHSGYVRTTVRDSYDVVELEGNGTEYHLLWLHGLDSEPILRSESQWDEEDGEVVNYRAGERVSTLELVTSAEESAQADADTEGSDQVGPIVFADETARRQLEQHGEVVTFRASERTVGDTWWRESRTGPKKGDCTVEYIGVVDPADRRELKPHRPLSGFRTVREWQDAIEALNGSLEEGHLYRVSSEERWAECERCHEYSPEVEPVGKQTDHVFLCPDCRPDHLGVKEDE